MNPYFYDPSTADEVIASSDGFFTEMGNFWIGKSDKTKRLERESEKEWRARRERKMNELLEARRVEVNGAKEVAKKNLEDAQKVALDRQEQLRKTQQLYEQTFNRHLSASRSRQVAYDQLQRLIAQGKDLVSSLLPDHFHISS